MLVVFWVVTPLAGSLFTASRVAVSINLPLSSYSKLLSVHEQDRNLDIGFLAAGYAHLWMGQVLPNFTTPDGAILPFAVQNEATASTKHGTLKATSRMYSTSLTCIPATIGGNMTNSLTFDNGKGCKTHEIDINYSPDKLGLYHTMYLGYYTDGISDYTLSELGCVNVEHSFLAIWAGDNVADRSNITALFCEPQYYTAKVNATIVTSNLTVSEVLPLEPKLPMSLNDFNISLFEYIIGVGIGPDPVRADIPQADLIDGSQRLYNMSISWPTSNMLKYAIGATHLQPDEYLDSTNLASSFEKAHKLLFALAMRQSMVNSPPNSNTLFAELTSDKDAILLFQPLAIVVQAFLGLVALVAIGLAFRGSFCSSQLLRDPSSLSSVLDMLRPSPFDYVGAYGRGPYKPSSSTANIVDNKIILPGSHCVDLIQKGSKEPRISKGEKGTAQLPREMRLLVGIAFLVLLIAVTTSLLLIKKKIQENDGLPVPSSSPVINQLLLNYVPIIFATLLEPFWVLLNRLLCMLRPVDALSSGEARASQSIDLQYASLPPQLVILRALRSKHFLLVLVCTCSLSANLLAVSMNGLLTTSTVRMHLVDQFETQDLPVIKQTVPSVFLTNGLARFQDHFRIASTNLTQDTILPPWMDLERYYLPFTPGSQTGSRLDAESFTAKTMAFAAYTECKDAAAVGGGMRVYPDVSTNEYARIELVDSIGHAFNCSTLTANTDAPDDEGSFAAEYISNLVPTNPSATVEQESMCSRTLLLTLLRADFTLNGSSALTEGVINQMTSFSGLWLICTSSLNVAPYNLTVDPIGHVIEAVDAGSPALDITSYFSETQNDSALFSHANHLLAQGISQSSVTNKPFWHNDTVADQWFTYLIKVLTNSTVFLDPSQPIPSVGSIAPAVEDVYRRLFAIYFGLNSDFFGKADSTIIMNGHVDVLQERVFMVHSMFIITVALLAFNILVAIIYYVKRPKKMLQEMPTTIARIVGLFAGSSLVQGDLGPGPTRDQHRLGYGKFIGLDGKPHTGIERRPFVIPWDDL